MRCIIVAAIFASSPKRYEGGRILGWARRAESAFAHPTKTTPVACRISEFKPRVGSATWPDQSKHRALRIAALDDPASARNLERPVQHLAAVVLDPHRGGVDVIDVKIVQ